VIGSSLSLEIRALQLHPQRANAPFSLNHHAPFKIFETPMIVVLKKDKTLSDDTKIVQKIGKKKCQG
jgi:hypothetical protein